MAEVKAAVDQWLAGQKLDDAAKAKIAALWAEDQLPAVSADILDRLAETDRPGRRRPRAIWWRCAAAASRPWS